MFEEIVEDEYGIHAFKVAAIEKTLAFPLEPSFQLGDPRLELAMLFLIIALLLRLRSYRLGQGPEFGRFQGIFWRQSLPRLPPPP